MSKKEALLIELLKRALYDLKEHAEEYHHVGEAGLIEEIEAAVQ